MALDSINIGIDEEQCALAVLKDFGRSIPAMLETASDAEKLAFIHSIFEWWQVAEDVVAAADNGDTQYDPHLYEVKVLWEGSDGNMYRSSLHVTASDDVIAVSLAKISS